VAIPSKADGATDWGNDYRAIVARVNALTNDATQKVPVAQLGAGSATSTTFLRGDNTWAVPAGGGSGAGSFVDEAFVDVASFGAVGDYIVSSGAGTDNTDAIQAAIDSTVFGGVNEGRVVYLSPGRYKTTGPLVLKQGTSLVGPQLVRTSALSNQASKYSATIEFFGGAAENAIQAIGTTTTSVSRVLVERFAIYDRRTSSTGGNGVYFEKVVNQSVVRNMDINGFATGSSVRVTAGSGQSSDCITVEDIWGLGAQYAVNIEKIDNTCFVRDIKCDSPSGQPLLAVVRINQVNGVVLIQGVKHENSKASAVTILLDTVYNTTLIDGVVSRVGTGGAVVSIANNQGGGVTVRGVQRQNSGVLLESIGGGQDKSISGTRLPFWVGGSDGIWINSANFTGLSTTGLENDIFVTGRLNASLTAQGFPGKLAVKPDSTSQAGLTVTGPASHATDYVRVYDSTNATLFRVDQTGQTVTQALAVAGPQKYTKKTTVADTAYTILATDYYVAVTSLTAGRTLTLPSASTVGDGFVLVIKDESGAAGTSNITVSRATAPQTIDGATTAVISTNYGALQLRSNGTNWFTV
jgi:hypothetical protein